MKVIWKQQPLFEKVPLLLVLLIVAFIGYNIYINIKIKNAENELSKIEQAAIKSPRKVPAEFVKKIESGTKCPSIKAGNSNALLKFKLFESETCPYCIAQNKVLDEIFLEYGDLFYGEWYQVVDCPQESSQYNIVGVPTFVFTVKGVEKNPAYGFLDEQQLTSYICGVTEGC